jgi:hypothetical protein
MTVRSFPRSASLAVLILGLVGAGHAMGQADRLDTDGDGLVSYTELLVAVPEMTEELTAAEEAGLITPG